MVLFRLHSEARSGEGQHVPDEQPVVHRHHRLALSGREPLPPGHRRDSHDPVRPLSDELRPGAFSKPSPTETGYEPFETPSRASRFAALRAAASPGVALQSGIFLAVAGAAAYAVGNVLRGAAVQNWNEPILGGLIGATAGLIMHLSTSSMTRRFWSLLQGADRVGIFLYVLSGTMTVTAQICAIGSFHYMPVSIANLITLSTPVLVTPLSYFLLRNQEGINFLTVLGSVLVLSGITAIILV
ncbi:EamA family transporter [Rubrobacter marinus]|uniref:EamA family transporter n=1 Tax=Rubrobacter marinus TaxID=2653852 RepID=A0A6G8Q0N1_9ACTN|nr:EamA family transporter [Rubrobacter marinus]